MVQGFNNEFFKLTTGKEIKLRDVDLNNDGEISESEISSAKESLQLNQSEQTEFESIIRSMDFDESKSITKEEFMLYQEKIEKEEQIEMINEEFNTLLNQLKETLGVNHSAIQSFINTKNTLIQDYTGEISKMKEIIMAQLQTEYDNIVASAQEGYPQDIEDTITDIIFGYIDTNKLDISDPEVKQTIRLLGSRLTIVANTYASTYDGLPVNFKSNLEHVLRHYLDDNICQGLQTEFANWNKYKQDLTQHNGIYDFEVYCSDKDLADLKAAAMELVTGLKAKGIQFVPEDIEGVIQEYPASGAKELLDLMDGIIEQIQNSPATNLALLENGYDAITIRVNGSNVTTNTPNVSREQAEEKIMEVLDEIFDPEEGEFTELQNYPDYPKWQANMYDDLKQAAINFYRNGSFSGVDDFKNQLSTYLETFVGNPLIELKASVNDWTEASDAINTNGIDGKDLEKLKKLFEEVWIAAQKANIQFCDASGNKLKLADVLKGYKIENARELQQLINNILKAISNFNMSMDEVYKANGNGKITFTLDGVAVAEQQAIIFWDDVKDGVETKIDELIDSISDVADISAHTAELYTRFNNIAKAFFVEWVADRGDEGTVENFISALQNKLSKLKTGLFGNIEREITQIVNKDIIDNTYYGCSDEEFAGLSKALEDLIALAESYGFAFYNAEGTQKLTASAILSKYDKSNASDLKTLILSMKASILSKESLSYKDMYEKYPDGKISVYINGTETATDFPIMMEDFSDDGIDKIDPNEYWRTREDAHKYIYHRISSQCERAARKVFAKYGLGWSWDPVQELLKKCLNSNLDKFNPDGHLNGHVYAHLQEVAIATKEDFRKGMMDLVKEKLNK